MLLMTSTDILDLQKLTRAERRAWYDAHRRDDDAIAAIVRHVAQTAIESPHVETREDANAFARGYCESLIGHGMGMCPTMLVDGLRFAITLMGPARWNQFAEVAS
jgi:hypothetical protein